MKRLLSIPFLILTLQLSAPAQSYQYINYGMEEGLCHESTNTLSQDASGFIWITTTQGLCRFDGKHFTSQFPGDTLPEAIVNASYRDGQGRLWFGYVDGQVAVFENNRLTLLSPREDNRSSIAGISENPAGDILLMTQQNGIIRVDQSLEMSYLDAPFEGSFVSSFYVMPSGDLLIGGFDGLKLFRFDASENTYFEAGKFPRIPYTRVQAIIEGLEEDTWWIGTEDEGLFRLAGSGEDPGSYRVTKMGVDHGLEYSSIASLLFDDSENLWVSDYGNGVYRFDLSDDGSLVNPLHFGTASGLPEAYIKDMLLDDEGNLWFATQGSGISILRDQAFTFYDFEGEDKIPQITAIELTDDRYWLGSDALVAGVGPDDQQQRHFLTPSSGLPHDRVTVLLEDSAGKLFIGTANNGIYLLPEGSNRVRHFFQTGNSLGRNIHAMDISGGTLWVATNNGAYSIDTESGEVNEHWNTMTALPHNVINDIMVDREGLVWIATRYSGLFCLNGDQHLKIQGSPGIEFVSMAEDDQGQIWAGTRQMGVFKFDQDTLASYSKANGLKSNYTYAIGIDKLGFVWVGHRLGLSRIHPEKQAVNVYGPEVGFTSDIQHNAIASTKDGRMLFGTNDGLILYDTRLAKIDSMPPRLSLTRVTISDSVYDASKPIQLPYDIYKLEIDYIGINLRNPDQVTYRYKLDGFDEWSEPTRQTTVKYSRIEDGDYTFMLRACDGAGNCTGEPLTLDISVKIPVWKAWWFIMILILVAVGTVFLIIKIRERNQKAIQDYLQQQLDERTREVIHQKEEIETKNRDITDSINYAQRIQASILPPIKKLHETFTGSFVFYQPRDIVSGDFYWYDRLEDDRFIIVCADSTGHGVPGAFMSMIGTTLIKDICMREDVEKPSHVLDTLDSEVREALNQNVESDGSNDGMDIIVAEINLRTHKFTVSSAMRPVIVYKNGEQIYVKGSRSSIGGQLDEGRMVKEFVDQEFDLSKGDIIYMFSDGYPDQFGGPLGRKFKMVRLKNLLRDIHDKPMDEQYNYIKSNFFLWKEDLEQVDDVLFMGIKL